MGNLINIFVDWTVIGMLGCLDDNQEDVCSTDVEREGRVNEHHERGNEQVVFTVKWLMKINNYSVQSLVFFDKTSEKERKCSAQRMRKAINNGT